MNGKVIVIEGGDGVGKTTQKNLLIEHLEKDKINFLTHHFPTYDSFHGKGVEMYLAGEFGEVADLSPYFINNLYAYDRSLTWQSKFKKEYQAGKNILFDRYTTSSLIYQTAYIEDINEKKAMLDYIVDFEYNKLETAKPDQVIFLHAPFEVIREMREARKNNAGIENDIHEKNLDFMKRVSKNAEFVANYFGWEMIECTKDGKMRTPEDIHTEIYKKLIIHK